MHAPNFKNPEIEPFKIRKLFKINPNLTELKPQRIFLNRRSAILRVDMSHYFESHIPRKTTHTHIKQEKNAEEDHEFNAFVRL